MLKYILIAMLIAGPALASDLPNSTLTPGAADPTATMAVVCGQSTSERRNVPQAEKNAVYAEYGMKGNDRSQCPDGFEVDHLISLELGGSNDIKNLWPQNYCGPRGARVKDNLENHLHALVCMGQVPLDVAQHDISTDWIAAYRKYVGPLQ